MGKFNNLSKKQLRNKRNSIRNKLRGIYRKIKFLKSDLEGVNIELTVRGIIEEDRLL